MKKGLIAIVLTIIISTSAYGSDDSMRTITGEVIQKLFSTYFKRNTPIKWVGNNVVGKVETIEFLKVERSEKTLKEYNDGQVPAPYNSTSTDCWPVQLHVKGIALDLDNKKYPFEDNPRFMLCVGYGPKPMPLFYPQGFMVAGNNL